MGSLYRETDRCRIRDGGDDFRARKLELDRRATAADLSAETTIDDNLYSIPFKVAGKAQRNAGQ